MISVLADQAKSSRNAMVPGRVFELPHIHCERAAWTVDVLRMAATLGAAPVVVAGA